jgi:glycosyltransferase involved in cell wall biosynthesis/Flp pilus assembly protein TadD
VTVLVSIDKQPKVSLCLIAKNEETNLPACLSGVAGLVDETVVVDTGSTDGTKEVAARYGARVFDFPWCDNFAAARNESLRHATGDWIFWLDADDRIDEENRRRLRGLFAALTDQNIGYIMRCVSRASATIDAVSVVDHLRVFRNHPEIRWEHRVHEQIVSSIVRQGGTICRADIVIDHAGYQDPELRHRKEERNLRLLLLDQTDHPNNATVLFHLGWTYHALNRSAEALPVLERALELADPGDNIVRKLYALIAQAHRRMDRLDRAAAVCRQGLERFPEDIELIFQHGFTRFASGDLPGAEADMRKLLQLNPGEYLAMGVNPALRGYLARHNLAVILRDQGRMAEAVNEWQTVVAEEPGYTEAWIGLADLFLGQGRWHEFEQIVQRLEAEPRRATEAAILRARMLSKRENHAAARQLLEEVVAREPRAAAPRLALSYALMQEGRDWDATEKAIRGVLELDPANAQARKNLEVVARKLRAVPRPVQTSAPLGVGPMAPSEQVSMASENPLRPELGPRVPQLTNLPSRRAHPRVSLCMIVKNEEANLSGCLDCVADLVDEIVIVDTGSTDDTKKVAARYGARVFDFLWCDDFAAARNESLRHAAGDWIFWLDADDRVDLENRRELRRLFNGLPDESAAYMMKCLCQVGEDPGSAWVLDHARLFRNHPQVRWQYRVHEQILPAVLKQGGKMHRADVTIRHGGYQDQSLTRRKEERNLRLLHLDQADYPNSPLVLYNLGKTYYMLGQPIEAISALERSLELSRPTDSFLRKLYATLVQCHQHLKQSDRALAACRQGLDRFPDDCELLYLAGNLRAATGDLGGAEASLKRLLQTNPGANIAMGINPDWRGYLGRHELALVLRRQNRHEEAAAEWRAALAERPDFVLGWLELGESCITLAHWQELESVLRQLEEKLHKNEDAAVLRARAHMMRKEYAAARSILEKAIAAAPRSLRPRLCLSHVLLFEGRDWAAAEKALRDVLALDPNHAEAQRNLEVLFRRLERTTAETRPSP